MNFYIWYHSTDESDTEEYMEFSIKYFIGYISDYTYVSNIYFNNMTDTPNEHHNNFILN